MLCTTAIVSTKWTVIYLITASLFQMPEKQSKTKNLLCLRSKTHSCFPEGQKQALCATDIQK